MCFLLGKRSRVVESQLEYPCQHDHDGAHDVHLVLLPPPRREPDAVVATARVFYGGLLEFEFGKSKVKYKIL